MARKATRGHLQTPFFVLFESLSSTKIYRGSGCNQWTWRQVATQTSAATCAKSEAVSLKGFLFFSCKTAVVWRACCIRATVRCRAAFLTHARLTALKPALGTILATLPYMLPLTHSNRHSMSVWLTRHAASSSPELSSSRFVLRKPQSDPGSDSSPGQRAKKIGPALNMVKAGALLSVVEVRASVLHMKTRYW